MYGHQALSVSSDGCLKIDGHSISELGDRFGTPLFIISNEKLASNYRTMNNAFTSLYPQTRIFYSFKTNYCLPICRSLLELGAGAEVTSDLELEVALKAGFPPSEIIFNGPCKTQQEIQRAVQLGLFSINADSMSEADQIFRVAAGHEKNVNIGIRLDPFEKSDHKLGMVAKDALEICDRLGDKPGITIKMIHCHLATQVLDPETYAQAVDRLVTIMSEIKMRFGITVKIVDLGGGFPSVPVLARSGAKIENFAESIVSSVLKRTEEKGMERPALVLEPGRYIVSDAIVCLGKIYSVKYKGSSKWCICDIGYNILPQAFGRSQYEIVIANKMLEKKKEITNIGGPLCATTDVLAAKIELPFIEAGDFVAVLDSGAYTMSFSNSFSRYRPAVILIDSSNVIQVNRRETYEDVTATSST